MGSWQLVAALPSRRPKFCPRAAHMRFVVETMQHGQILCEHSFLLSVIVPKLHVRL